MPPPYLFFRLIAYEVPTLTPSPPGAVLPADTPTAPVPTLADDPALTPDALTRLKRFAAVAEFARHRVNLLDFPGSPDTLKILMAPEFYFRPNSGHNNSYDMAVATSMMRALKSMFTNPVWTDWLIVAGTIFWRETTPPPGSSWYSWLGSILGNQLLAQTEVYWNTSIVVKGGLGGQNFSVDKTVMSNLDGAPAGSGPENSPYFKDYFNLTTRKRSLLSIDGIQFGIEICLDHNLKEPYLRTTCTQYWDTYNVYPIIQLHLLIACGMPIKPASVAAETGGYILRCDGKDDLPEHSNMCRVTNQTYSDATAITPADTGGTPYSNDIRRLPILDSALRVGNNLKFTNGPPPQAITIYLPRPIPLPPPRYGPIPLPPPPYPAPPPPPSLPPPAFGPPPPPPSDPPPA